MDGAKANGKNLVQGARMVVHEDERAILQKILQRTLGDDDCFAKVVSRDRSEGARAQDRLVLARFFGRMERQFAIRAARSDSSHRAVVADQASG